MQKSRLNFFKPGLKHTSAWGVLLYFFSLVNIYAQSNSVFFRDDFNNYSLGDNWYAPYSWSVINGYAYNFVDGTGGVLKTSQRFTAPSYVVETVAKGFTNNYYREFRITFGQTNLANDSTYVLSYTPYSGGQLTLARSTTNIYLAQVLDEISLYPDLEAAKFYKFKIAKFKSGLIQVYLDKGNGYSTIPVLEAIDNTYPQLGHFGWQIDTQTAPENFFIDWIVARLPTVEKPAVREKPTEDNLITQVSVTSGRPYKVAKLNVGEQQYTDRPYTITAVPDYLKGASFIQSAIEDKYDSSNALLTMFLKKAVILYVAYDPRAGILPAWLNDWKKTGDIIRTTDPGITYLEVYSKLVEYPNIYPKPFFLGGNLASPAAGSQTNYLVAAIEKPAPLKLEAEEATLSGALVATNHVGYSGTGFVDYINSSEDYIEWTTTIEVPGAYSLGLSFANGKIDSRALAITVDGASIVTYPFSSTYGWENWAFYGGPMVYLSKGTHTIRATAIGESGPNVDYLSLYYAAPTIIDSPVSVNLAKVASKRIEKDRSVFNNSHGAYPNPFENSTTISYSLTEKMPVQLTIFTLQGQKLQVLIQESQAAGAYQAAFNAGALPKGIYIYQLQTGRQLRVGKIVKQ